MPSSTISGVVSCLDGANLMWASLEIIPTEGEGIPRVNVGHDDGAYSIGGLDAGEYTVKAHYMVEPSGEPDVPVQPQVYDAGTIQLGVDADRTFDIAIPCGE